MDAFAELIALSRCVHSSLTCAAVHFLASQ
jgi:hypothetical protein